MKFKRKISALLTVVSLLSFSVLPIDAINMENPSEFVIESSWSRASSEFSARLSPEQSMTSKSELSLDAGETVRINASYTPDGSMDFGLVDKDGKFYYINIQNGTIDKTLRISKRGNYRLKIQNNTRNTVSVSGYIKY